jgi:hypothetical protein
MSDYRAIQGVTSSIKNVLEKHMVLNRPQVAPSDRIGVTVGLPDREGQGRRVNIFLYHITECPYLRNQDLPGSAHPGEYGQPPLALDLHYLITAYTESDDDDQLEAHQILGDAVCALHDHPLLLGNVLDPALEGAFERAKVTLAPLTVEDITKVWVSLSAPYRLSVGYKATVVQLESRLTRSRPGLVKELPGGGPRIVVAPIRRPRITELFSIQQGDASLRERVPHGRLGDTLVIDGQNLDGDLRLLLDEVDVTSSITLKRPDRLEATLPDDPALQAGPVTVRVAAQVLLGNPPTPHRGISSNLSAFVLVPRVDQLSDNLAANPRTLRLTGTRLFAPHRDCLTLIGDRVIPGVDYTTHSEAEIMMNLPADLAAGTYPVRVRVHGAESLDAQNLVIP